jgi:glycosyltransferase involved in cell wall biosynthesis
MKTILFHRDFLGFSGGHMKVWDYFQHTKASGFFKPVVYMTPGSFRDASNPWVVANEEISNAWKPNAADALFLGGMDWLAVPKDLQMPTINLIQHICHADPTDPRYAFLERPALRICVSQQVSDAILSTGKVNGQVLTISAGLDTKAFPAPAQQRDIPLLIAGLKQPELAIELSNILSARGVESLCLTQQLPRAEFLGMLGRAGVTVFLPHRGEGFYLPALEGMALGTLVVCPDSVGNRDFCIPEFNCLQPAYDIHSMVELSLQAVVRIHQKSCKKIIEQGIETARVHRLDRERDHFHQALQNWMRKFF